MTEIINNHPNKPTDFSEPMMKKARAIQNNKKGDTHIYNSRLFLFMLELKVDNQSSQLLVVFIEIDKSSYHIIAFPNNS